MLENEWVDALLGLDRRGGVNEFEREERPNLIGVKTSKIISSSLKSNAASVKKDPTAISVDSLAVNRCENSTSIN